MRKVVLIGANGQLGHDLCAAFSKQSDEFDIITLTHADIEIVNHAGTCAILSNLKPHIVINTAAYHRVDECEDQVAKAFEINAIAIRNLAESCRDLDAVLVHLSTDYVFGGDTGRKSSLC